MKNYFCLFTVLILLLSACSTSDDKNIQWQALTPNAWHNAAPGLDLGKWDLENLDDAAELIALRIDPMQYNLELMSATQHDKRRLSARKWQQKFNKTAVINAAMYGEDVLTSTGFFRIGSHINNDVMSSFYQMAFVSQPKEEDLPFSTMIDLQNQDPEILKKYRHVVCGMRMISSDSENVWHDQKEKWNEAALAMDINGRIYWLLSLKKYYNHQFIELIKKQPFELRHTMHLDGGSPVSMYFEDDNYLINIIGGKDVSPKSLFSILRTHKLPLVLTCSSKE